MANLAEHQSLARRVWQDRLKMLAFNTAFLKKRKLLQRRRELRTPHDFFSFGRKAFHLVQNEPEVLGLLSLIESTHPKVVCEIGTRSCGTSFLLSQAIPSVQTFIGLDLYVSNWKKFKLFARPDQQVHSIDGSSYSQPIVDEVKRILKGRPIDMLFIDGDHSYEGAKKDFLLYSPLVRDGGLIALHDIVQDHRTRLGTDSPGYSGGVPTLWNALKAIYPHHEFIENPEQDGFGIGAITFQSNIPLPSL